MKRKLNTAWSPILCSFCRKNYVTNDHHLKPLTGTDKEIAPSCFKCHNDIHKLFTNEELDEIYNTVEILKKELEKRRDDAKKNQSQNGNQ
jgi:hypothetical protein